MMVGNLYFYCHFNHCILQNIFIFGQIMLRKQKKMFTLPKTSDCKNIIFRNLIKISRFWRKNFSRTLFLRTCKCYDFIAYRWNISSLIKFFVQNFQKIFHVGAYLWHNLSKFCVFESREKFQAESGERRENLGNLLEMDFCDIPTYIQDYY